MTSQPHHECGPGYVTSASRPRLAEVDTELLRDLDHAVGVALLLGVHGPRTVGLAVDGAQQNGDVERVVLGQLDRELVLRTRLLAAEQDVGRHAERLRRRVDLGVLVVGREDRVLRDACRRLVEREDHVLVVAGRGLGTGAVVTLVDDVALGGGHEGVALRVLPEVGAVPVLVAPEDGLGDAGVHPDDPEVEVDLVVTRSLVPAQSGLEGRTGELLLLALPDEQLRHLFLQEDSRV